MWGSRTRNQEIWGNLWEMLLRSSSNYCRMWKSFHFFSDCILQENWYISVRYFLFNTYFMRHIIFKEASLGIQYNHSSKQSRMKYSGLRSDFTLEIAFLLDEHIFSPKLHWMIICWRNPWQKNSKFGVLKRSTLANHKYMIESRNYCANSN